MHAQGCIGIHMSGVIPGTIYIYILQGNGPILFRCIISKLMHSWPIEIKIKYFDFKKVIQCCQADKPNNLSHQCIGVTHCK